MHECFIDDCRLYNLQMIKSKIPVWTDEVETSPTLFKQFYQYCFQWSKEPGQKSMSM